ncbi:type II/IV secretion system protein [Actinobacillus succinogenes]|uniref:Type II secretion system protein E n=1 Tax=Actinobacillus succinogenes (strain ATCC 55618 / DSM 22257 / CCUG 43843 / 130Z) TaxID=339671 RepID=A6VLY9_ACTSZ|nr:GspE/PulE family protein [Actinobacillus succinogenes]ABR73986.1 type II secretion system protein E [Actinobacillus succinogenes 130Z]PHI39573.1 type II/IV secretion system protein [Actinobacillus succinogenes]
MSGDHKTVTTSTGETIEISPHLWTKNQDQQALLVRFLALPLQENDSILWLGLDSLTNLSACETFAFLTGKIIEPVLLTNQELKRCLQALSPQTFQVEENPIFYTEETTDVEQKSDDTVIQLLNQIFENALHRQASDIHLEPRPDCLQVRFRIDGVLQNQTPISSAFANRVISRLKLLAKLDISEMRLPQDGRFHFKTTFSDVLDLRLSTLPTNLGEKAVLRVQQNKPVTLAFSDLGMNENQQRIFRYALSQPQGLILVTGPTGSGKSITLYTALSSLNSAEKHIMTAEDPIEIELDGIIQTQINPAVGLDFSRLLRTFLRQDPDIIMLGEIRDEESAAMALRAAQTGHLVLSTLHTNDASSAISRLRQLGIQQHEIDSTLLLVIAQRLIRKCCPKCITRPDDNYLDTEKCGQKSADSCDCHQGYKGRVGIYQLLQPDFSNAQQQYRLDFPDLYQAGLEKINTGITDFTEIQRVLGVKNET